jgi:hypothetical protein
MKKKYFYIDVNVKTMRIIKTGISTNATHTGQTGGPTVHRVFLTVGQYNKFKRAFKESNYNVSV